MAKCPKCGKIWDCGNNDDWLMMFYEEDHEHCEKCRCKECRRAEP